MNKINISFWGSPQISAGLLDVLIHDGRFNVQFVVTQPDKPRSHRGRELQPSPVKKVALKNNIPVFEPYNLKTDQAQLLEKMQQYDVMFHLVLAYGHFIPSVYYTYPEKKAVNFHASLLPRLRGAAPIEAALMQGYTETGFSLQAVTKKLDAGEVYAELPVTIDWADTRDSLYLKLSETLFKNGPDVLVDYAAGKLKGKPQDEEQATHCGKIQTSDGVIDFGWPVLKIRNLARALQEKPGIFGYYAGKKVKLYLDFEVPEHEIDKKVSDYSPGTIDSIEEDRVLISCKDGRCLPVVHFQVEGKKKVSATDFANGYRVKPTDRMHSVNADDISFGSNNSL